MRVLIIDDTTLFRKVISDAISSDPEIDLVGRARNGVVGLNKIRELKPDIVTLDLDMPEMNGLEVLKQIEREKIDTGIIVVSAHTTAGGAKTIEALQHGAFDFITKPSLDSIEKNMEFLKSNLLPKLKAWKSKTGPLKRDQAKVNIEDIVFKKRGMIGIPEMVAIGISTGGPNALRQLLPKFHKSFRVPILIVQHMPAIFTNSLADMLDKISPLKVKEAADGEILKQGFVYIAPGDKQMKIICDSDFKKIKLTDDPPENSCRPSVDYLFRSLANNFPGKTVSVIMTGMGHDGCLGVKLLKRHGCISIVQDEESSTIYGMPQKIVEAKLADVIVPLEDISDSIIAAVN